MSRFYNFHETYYTTFGLIQPRLKTWYSVFDRIEKLKINNINKYSHYPTYDIVNASKIQKVNVSFGQTNIRKKKFDFQCCKESVNTEDEIDIAGAELYLRFQENDSSFSFKLCYDANLFKEYQITEITQCYKNLLSKISKNPHEIVTKINLLNKKSKDKLLYKWNNTDKSYPSDKTIHSLFEEQVIKAPNNIAVVYEDIKLTYKELNNKANQLAHYLIKHHNIKPDSLIALLLDRSEHIIIAILAVLKAGAAYVPMDPNYPDDRIKYILDNTNTNIVITNNIYNSRINKLSKINAIPIDNDAFSKTLNILPSANPIVNNLTSNNLAYVIYTSGTTGNPKGVMIQHYSVVNLLSHMNKSVYNVYNKLKNIAAFTSYIFDVSVSEFFSLLLSGNILHILPDITKNDSLLISKYINRYSINYLYLPPVLLSQLPKIKYNTLDKIIYAGEACDKDTALYWSKRYKLYNYYGPTETTIYLSGKQIINSDVESIGRPISNTKAYVLSTELSPLPVGAIGELYIGGAGLARGYLNNPKLTKEKFIPNPFQTNKEKLLNKNSRLYKTGDLVRWLPSGELEYIGRNDFQVKIRGFRIELGEIESVISEYKDIKQAVVLAKENKEINNKYLVAYYTSDKGNKLNEDNLLTYVSTKLPEYMIPTAIVHMDKLPLTLNGKLDRKALPDPVLGSDKDSYTPPRNELETKLRDIFASVLGLKVSKIGINNDFFKLGGDSIVSIQIVSRIRQNLSINYITIKDIFSHKTIAKLYDNIIKPKLDKIDKVGIVSDQGILSGNVLPLLIQKWFFDSKFQIPHHWNQAFIIKTLKLDIKILQKCIELLIHYHDAFRLRFNKKDNSQYYHNKAKAEKLKVIDVSKLSPKKKLHDILTNLQSNFNLQKGPTYSIAYLHGFKDNSARIFFALHHLIVDAVSWRILTQNLKGLYTQANNGHSLSLGNKLTSYRQWSNIVNNYYTDIDKDNKEKAYWSNITKGIVDSNALLNKFAYTKYYNFIFNIDSKLTNSLLKQANNAFNTEINDLLLSALALALNNTLESDINYITLEGHGREDSITKDNVDLSNTLGWFTSIYPVKLNSKDGIASTIKQIKECLRSIPSKGIGYGPIMGYSTLPLISFNYLGQLDLSSNNDDYWNIVNEDTGITINTNNKDKNIININGAVTNGKLSFSVVSKLGSRLHNKLVTSFKQKLEEVIIYTSTLKRSYLTSSDVDNIVIQQYLDQVQDKK